MEGVREWLPAVPADTAACCQLDLTFPIAYLISPRSLDLETRLAFLNCIDQRFLLQQVAMRLNDVRLEPHPLHGYGGIPSYVRGTVLQHVCIYSGHG